VVSSAVSGSPAAIQNLQPHFYRHVRQQARLEESADDIRAVYRLETTSWEGRDMTTLRRNTSIR